MPSDFSVYLTSRLTRGADTFRSFAAPPIVPVTITARITSTWRNVIMGASFEMTQPKGAYGIPGGDSANGGRSRGFRMPAPGGGFNSIGAGSGGSACMTEGAVVTGASTDERGTAALALGGKRRGSRPGAKPSPGAASGWTVL